MPKCAIRGCKNHTRYKNTVEIYCSMHRARLKRHGTLLLKKDSNLDRKYATEKLPHPIVDDFIKKNWKTTLDRDMAKALRKMGYRNTTEWNAKYRRRTLGFKKYLTGDIQKHREWVRRQAIKKYGKDCAICGYSLHIEVHHITPYKEGGNHELDNLMVLCPNCHALVTRKRIILEKRRDLPRAKIQYKKLLRGANRI